jgi:hypothetical protein
MARRLKILMFAGIVAILLFATIGQLSHDHRLTWSGYAEDALPLLAGWLVVAWRTQRFVPTWLVGVTGGVLVRMVILSHERWNELAFLAVALVFIGAVAGVLVTAASRTRPGRRTAR